MYAAIRHQNTYAPEIADASLGGVGLVEFWPCAALLGFLLFAVAVEGFIEGKSGMSAQPQFEFFAERSGRADYIR